MARLANAVDGFLLWAREHHPHVMEGLVQPDEIHELAEVIRRVRWQGGTPAWDMTLPQLEDLKLHMAGRKFDKPAPKTDPERVRLSPDPDEDIMEGVTPDDDLLSPKPPLPVAKVKPPKKLPVVHYDEWGSW